MHIEVAFFNAMTNYVVSVAELDCLVRARLFTKQGDITPEGVGYLRTLPPDRPLAQVPRVLKYLGWRRRMGIFGRRVRLKMTWLMVTIFFFSYDRIKSTQSPCVWCGWSTSILNNKCSNCVMEKALFYHRRDSTL